MRENYMRPEMEIVELECFNVMTASVDIGENELPFVPYSEGGVAPIGF